MTGRTFAALVLALLILMGEVATAEAGRPRGRRNRIVSVQVQMVAVGRLGRSVAATGTLLARSEVKLMSRAEGQAQEVLVREGARVVKGQNLARLDSTIKRIDLELSKSELAAAQANLAKLKSGSRPEEIAAAAAAVTQAEATRKRSEAEITSALARREEAEANALSLGALHKTGVISAQEWRKVTTEANRARADVAERRARLAEDAARVRAAQERLKLVKIGARAEDLAMARAQVSQRRQRVRRLKVELEYFTVRSPISGVVTARRIEPGDLAVNRAHLFTIAQTDTLRARVRVSELDLPLIKIGQGARVELDAYRGRTFSGQLTRIFPSVDPSSRQLIVEVDVQNSDSSLRPGLLARVKFEPLLGREAINLPVHAVLWDGDLRTKTGAVFVVRRFQRGAGMGGPGRGGFGRRSEAGGSGQVGSGRRDAARRGMAEASGRGGGGRGPRFMAVRREVRLGEMIDGRIEILEGLRVGERVVVSAISQLRDRRPIRVVGP
ncbi:MAG: efflux RND transporter periplasmic adaptor subunit [Nitrospinae bacterium]|nr:efflux RND transporter periplasmic adaptor subunit [Nitrospinota bacterium]